MLWCHLMQRYGVDVNMKMETTTYGVDGQAHLNDVVTG